MVVLLKTYLHQVYEKKYFNIDMFNIFRVV